jgi:hypothetical protein
MKIFSSNITGLPPVMKKTSPTEISHEKVKEGTQQEQPWIVQGAKKNYKQQQNTKNNNFKQQLMTNMVYSSAVSSVGPPLYLPKGESQPDPESVAATAAATANMNLSINDRWRYSTTSTIDNAPALNKRGVDEGNKVTTAHVTGSLLQKPVTLAAANLGSCDKNPGKADTTINTGAIVGNEGGSIQSWFDLRGYGEKSGRGIDKGGGIRPAAGKKLKN